MTKSQVLDQLKRVADEYHAARFAVGRALSAAMRTPHALPATIRPNDLRLCLNRLEATYLVMLFAEFESAIRRIWSAEFGRKTKPRMEVLLDRVAAKAHVSDTGLGDVHRVRKYRNFLVHGEDFAASVTLEQAGSLLARFLSFMPGSWS